MYPELYIVIADDDEDDCLLFKEAFDSFDINAQLFFITDGVKLMEQLPRFTRLPDILFLDLNMPCKDGITCLDEIKQNPILEQLPVIILSTSGEPEMVNKLYQKGALLFIRKPNEFQELKKLLQKAVTTVINDQLLKLNKSI